MEIRLSTDSFSISNKDKICSNCKLVVSKHNSRHKESEMCKLVKAKMKFFSGVYAVQQAGENKFVAFGEATPKKKRGRPKKKQKTNN